MVFREQPDDWRSLYQTIFRRALYFLGNLTAAEDAAGRRSHGTLPAAGGPDQPWRLAHDGGDGMVLLLRHSGESYRTSAEQISCAESPVGQILHRAGRRFKAAYERLAHHQPTSR